MGATPERRPSPEAPIPPTRPQETTNGIAGTVLLSVNPEIEMDYDDLGNVVALNALNDDGQSVLAGYTDYEGRPCHRRDQRLGWSDQRRAGYFDGPP